MNAGIEVLAQLGARGEPYLVTQLMRAYWASCILRAAVKLELFTRLKRANLTSEEIALQIGANDRYMRALLDACVVLELMEKIGSRYRNTDVSETYLVKGETKYMGGNVILYTERMIGMAHLDSAVLNGNIDEWKGKKLNNELMTKEEFVEFWGDYMSDCHARAVAGQIDLLLNNTDLTGRKRLLDVAGGPGSYSIALCQKYPDLTAVLFDLKRTIALARPRIESAGLSNRITLLAGDWSTTPFGEGYDVVLFSGALSQVDMDMYRFLLKKAYASMAPGGLLIIQDVLRLSGNLEKAGFSALYDLWMIACHTSASGVYSGDEISELLTSVGFVSPQQLSQPGLYEQITAVKP